MITTRGTADYNTNKYKSENGAPGRTPVRPVVVKPGGVRLPLIVDADVVDWLPVGVNAPRRNGHRLAIHLYNVDGGQDHFSGLLADDLVLVGIDALPGACFVIYVRRGVVLAIEVDRQVAHVRIDRPS